MLPAASRLQRCKALVQKCCLQQLAGHASGHRPQEGRATECSWFCVQVRRGPMQHTRFYSRRTGFTYLGMSCSVKGLESTTRHVTPQGDGQSRATQPEKGTALLLAGSRNLRQTHDFSRFHPKTHFFGLSDTLSCWADQDLGAQAIEFRPFKNANILINNPEDLPSMGRRHFGG